MGVSCKTFLKLFDIPRANFSVTCRLEGGLKVRWPRNLSVKCLIIVGSLSQKDIENLSTIECELYLNMDCVGAEQMYQLLELLGPLVKSLAIGDSWNIRKNVVYIKSDIIVERIFMACPNLVALNYNNYTNSQHRQVVQDNQYNMPPAAFKNYNL